MVHASRVLRLSHSVDVLASLDLAASLAASRADLVTYLLRLSMHNLQVRFSSTHPFSFNHCIRHPACNAALAVCLEDGQGVRIA